MLVQGSSIFKLVKIAMSTFDSHALQEVGAYLSWATYSNANNRTSEHLATPLTGHVDTTHAHVYLNTAIGAPRTSLLSAARGDISACA